MTGRKYIWLLQILVMVALARPSSGQAKPVVPDAAEPLPLTAVRLLPGPFKTSQDAHGRYLLSLSTDRLVARFRLEAGLPIKANAYPGWESVELPGVAAGFYLSGCSRMWASTGDRRYLDRVRTMLDELEACQSANHNGYLLATREGKRIFGEIERGDIRFDNGWLLNGQPEPYYAMEKLFSGLRDAYRVAGQRKGLTIATHLADWLSGHMGHLSDAQMQRIMACEFGGMNWVLADLYADTGNHAYMALSQRWQEAAILNPLIQGEDILPGKHANTQFPKLSGLAARYPYTGVSADRIAPAFFWDRVAHHHSYATGGNSLGEHFGPPDRLRDRLGSNTEENCNSWNMLRLTNLLFCIDPRADYADYAERVLWNHLLPAQNPADGAVCYFLPLATGTERRYEPLYDRFACCTCSGFDSYARHADSLYYTAHGTLFINQYIASTARWTAQDLSLRQETSIPYQNTARFSLTLRKPHRLKLAFRCPSWATEGMHITVNGVSSPVGARPGSYLVLDQTWRTGDVVALQIPEPLRAEPMPDDPHRVAFFKGPVLLSGELGQDRGDLSNADEQMAIPDRGGNPTTLLESIPGRPLNYKLRTLSAPNGIVLSPFFSLRENRYALYWDVTGKPEWAAMQATRATERARLAALDARTIDHVEVGIPTSEAAHKLQSERSNTGFGAYGTHMSSRWRDAVGWFEYVVKVSPDRPVELRCTYWGHEVGTRKFDVLVDGVKVAAESLDSSHPEAFYEVTYTVPPELTRNKSQVTVRFQAHPGDTAGGLFGLRVLPSDPPH
ncbi:MAG: hypothetical protein JWN14_1332 [Chthonomonadales bacterium]|nr:hypothetical protein [Chthonomonadales bacterium]